jgi:outer membrane lipoprotein-sorting protein
MRRFLLLLLSLPLLAVDADTIVAKVQHNLQSDSSYAKITMTVTTSRGERTMKMESWSRGNEMSFIKVVYPKKDYGITFLKRDTAMWQYVPKIERTIKIPGSMMMQSWMGSDFTNDDMAKESSIVDDYTPSLVSETPTEYLITLTPKPEAAVVWGHIEMEIAKAHCIPLKAVYFDEEGKKVRVLQYSDVTLIDGRHFPSVMTLTPLNKPAQKTVVIMEAVDFDASIDASRFSKSALRRYSR